MNILEIYKKYTIPSSLQTHQLRTAAVGAYIADQWKNPTDIDKEAIIHTLLLHDMGNIIKFDLDKEAFFTDKEKMDLPYWKDIQKKLKNKYEDEHPATYAIAKEIGVSDKIYYLLTHMGNSNLYKTITIDNWELKIVSYADLRCAPLNVVSVNERFDDIIARYKGRSHEHANAAKVEEKRNYCLEVERQIQSQVKITLTDITEEKVKDTIEELKNYEI